MTASTLAPHSPAGPSGWEQLTSVFPAPPLWLILITAVAASALLTPRLWPVTRNLITIAHEGGHALVAVCCGRRLAGIKLHADTSGVTISAGKPTGLGVVATTLAGYLAPAGMGAVFALVLATGHVTALLWGIVALLAAMLVMIRNAYGVLTVVTSGAGLASACLWVGPQVQYATALLLTWFLLIAAPLPVWELHCKRRDGLALDSDADQLARLTGVPALAWTVVFAAGTLAALAFGAVQLAGSR